MSDCIVAKINVLSYSIPFSRECCFPNFHESPSGTIVLLLIKCISQKKIIISTSELRHGNNPQNCTPVSVFTQDEHWYSCNVMETHKHVLTFTWNGLKLPCFSENWMTDDYHTKFYIMHLLPIANNARTYTKPNEQWLNYVGHYNLVSHSRIDATLW